MTNQKSTAYQLVEMLAQNIFQKAIDGMANEGFENRGIYEVDIQKQWTKTENIVRTYKCDSVEQLEKLLLNHKVVKVYFHTDKHFTDYAVKVADCYSKDLGI